MKIIDAAYLRDNYDALLIDAYGVLVNGEGPLAGAKEFLAMLRAAQKPFVVVTNDGARLPETLSARMHSFGLDIAPEQIVSSASLIAAKYNEFKLHDAPTVVIGSAEARRYVELAGGQVVRPQHAPEDLRVIVVCETPDGDAFGLLSATLDVAMDTLDRGKPLDLILCNPDLIYPRGITECPGLDGKASRQLRTYGFTSGSIMMLLEQGIATRHRQHMPRVSRLGKPFPDIFAEGQRRTGGKKIALLGDQLATDVKGALDYGIDAVLVGTGLTRVHEGSVLVPEPTFFLPQVSGA